ncbi:MAG: CD225/dispanin family protein [bacterium]
MRCPRCGTEKDPNTYRCVGCGEELHRPRRTAVGRVDNYLVYAILVTLFCCQPFGIVAIVFAALSMTRADAGDVAGARAYADKARTWCTVGFWLGLLWMAVVLFLLQNVAVMG